MASDEQPFSDIEHALKRAAAALRDAGVPFRDGESLVDLIYCPKGMPIDDDAIARGEGSPVARAFFFVLLEGLEIVPGGPPRAPSEPRVRVVTPQGSAPARAG